MSVRRGQAKTQFTADVTRAPGAGAKSRSKSTGDSPLSRPPGYAEPLSGTTLASTVRINKTSALTSKSASLSATISLPAAERVLSPSDFEAVAILGKGAFGVVYLVVDKTTSQEFALKMVDKAQLLLCHFGDMFEEQRIGRFLRDSPWALPVEGSFHDRDYFYILTRYCKGGSLDQRIGPCLFSKKATKRVVAELILAVEDLHSRRVLHGDIKLENILMDEHGHIVLADFGHAKGFGVADSERPWKRYRIWDTRESHDLTEDLQTMRADVTYSQCGTPGYIAPEGWEGGTSYEADIWSVGVTFYMLYYGEFPFGMEPWRQSTEELRERTMCDEVEHRGIDLCPHAADLMDKMLEKDPSMRITINDIKQHPYFDSLDWDRIAERLPSSNPIPGPSRVHDGREPQKVTIPSGDSYKSGAVPFPWFQYSSPALLPQYPLPSDMNIAELKRPSLPSQAGKDFQHNEKRPQPRLEGLVKVNKWLKFKNVNKLRPLPPGERMILD